MISLATVINQNCAHCDGKIMNCKRFDVSYDGTELIFEHKTCEASEEFTKSETAKKIIKKAHVPTIFVKTRATDFTKNGRGDRNKEAMAAAENAIFDNESLFINGRPGTGKTFLASVIAIERAYEGKYSNFANVPDVLDDLRDFNQKTSSEEYETPQEKLRKLYKTPCLILDDLGAEKSTDWTCETLFKIVNKRYNDGKQLIITSNFNIDELQRKMDFTAGDRIIRRICDMCTPIQVF